MSAATVSDVPVRTLDRRGRLRSPAAMPGFNKGNVPVTKGRRLPPDPIRVEETVALLGACGPLRAGRMAELSALRLRALIIVLWRTGLRISEALALEERDLNRADLAITVRRGKGDKRRLSAMDEWAWKEIETWLAARQELPFGAIFCVLSGPTAGQPLSDTDARRQLRDAAKRAGLRRRANPHSFRHAHAVELWREDIDVYTIQQQLGHARLDVTAAYLRGVAPVEILEPIGHRRPPTMAVPSATPRR
jgi:site-specific recombinase XerD